MCACAITCLLIKNLGKSLDYDWQEWLDIEEGGMGKWWRRQVDEETRREQRIDATVREAEELEEAEEKASMEFKEAERDVRYEKGCRKPEGRDGGTKGALP